MGLLNDDTLWHLFISKTFTCRDIQKDLFCSLPNLSQLYLADNQLSDISFDLNCLKSLRHVDLQGNKIKRLDQVQIQSNLRTCNYFVVNCLRFSKVQQLTLLSGHVGKDRFVLCSRRDWKKIGSLREPFRLRLSSKNVLRLAAEH